VLIITVTGQEELIHCSC